MPHCQKPTCPVVRAPVTAGAVAHHVRAGNLRVRWNGAPGTCEVSAAFQVLWCAVLGGIALGQAAPNIQYFVAGRAAGARLFAVLGRQPLIADRPGAQSSSKQQSGAS